MNVFVSELMWFLMGDKDSIFSDADILVLLIYLEVHSQSLDISFAFCHAIQHSPFSTYHRVLQNCCHCYHLFPWNHHEQGVLQGGGSTFFYAEKRAAATTFTPFLFQNERKKGKIHEAKDDHTPEKGGGYGHTETRHRTDRTEHTEG